MILSILKDMEFDTISPLDGRYREETKPLLKFFSESANLEYMVRVEIALLDTHLAWHNLPCVEEISVDVSKICEIEKRTRHQVKAVVEYIRQIVPDYAKPFVHLGITSSDTQDTANVLRIRHALEHQIRPAVNTLSKVLKDQIIKYGRVEQIGRTHGQWAVPMTFGWWLAQYVSRLSQVRLNLKPRANMSGAVGTFRALSYLYEDPISFSGVVVNKLGLSLAMYTTQILPADELIRLLGEVNICFGIVANLADDIRHLQRSEISEVEECFYDGQVGSSTMPHKHNPWNSEHVKSLWKAFAPRYLSFSMDLISEHQRDLTNSASSRFVFEYLAGFYIAVKRMTQVVRDLRINADIMQSRVDKFEDTEKAYVLLAETGDADAHKHIQEVVEKSRMTNTSFRFQLVHSEYWNKIKDKYDKVGKDVIQRLV